MCQCETSSHCFFKQYLELAQVVVFLEVAVVVVDEEVRVLAALPADGHVLVTLQLFAVQKLLQLREEEGEKKERETSNHTQHTNTSIHRSEERRVGKECRSRWSQYH